MIEFEAAILEVMADIESPIPRPKQCWTHFKGSNYLVLGIVFDADGEHLIPRVTYTPIDGSCKVVYSRTLASFCGHVDNRAAARFVLVDA